MRLKKVEAKSTYNEGIWGFERFIKNKSHLRSQIYT